MAEVSLGLGPLNVKFDFSFPWWGRLKNMSLGPDPIEAVYLFLNQSRIQINKQDDGEILLFLSLVNASRKTVVVDKLIINYWQCSGNVMPDISPNVYGAGTIVERYKHANMTIRFTLNSSMISRIKNASTPASNVFSSPGIHIKGNGQLFIKESNKPIDFEVYSPSPQCYVYSEF